jgi:hypothetical protein
MYTRLSFLKLQEYFRLSVTKESKQMLREFQVCTYHKIFVNIDGTNKFGKRGQGGSKGGSRIHHYVTESVMEG